MPRDITKNQRKINEKMFDIIEDIDKLEKKAMSKLDAAYIYDETGGQLREQVRNVFRASSQTLDDLRMDWLIAFERGRK